ncbi:MAG: polysaccharide biosynthesis protein [Rhodospirillaceae bacterium]
MSPVVRVLLVFLHDIVACAAAWLLAFALRFNLEPIPEPWRSMSYLSLAWVVPVYGALFLSFGLYRGLWRFASLPDLKRIVGAVGIGAVAVPTLSFIMRHTGIPRSVLIMSPLFLAMLMGGSRLAYRAWKEQRLDSLIPGDREPVFVLGGAESAVALIKDLARSPLWNVVGVFDADGGGQGRQLHGVNVLGSFMDLERWAKKLSVLQVIIAMPEATHSERRRAVDHCRAAGLKVLTVPSLDDLVSGRVTVSQVRHVELDDLLGRDPVTLDTAGLRQWLSDHVVMVTGAGGSIGAELCRQVAEYRPKRLILFELNEFALYTVEQQFSLRYPNMPIVCAVGDVKDMARVDQVMAQHKPSVVFHAAAYKHVPLMENENAWQAILNNVKGTQVVATAAQRHGVEKFVLISTDKAVNPTNVMGASKRLAEMVCQALQQPRGTRFVMVRFGNVLGSTGSVIPKFREQIARGGPVTVTHPDITRYFMSIPEAAQLVLQAGLMGHGGEVFVLDMGEPVKIADLARDMIRLSGFNENDIRIVYTGLRPGEKLYEELLAADENTVRTPHPKLRIARVRQENGQWLERLNAWLAREDLPHDDTVKRELCAWVPEYQRDPAAPVAA